MAHRLVVLGLGAGLLGLAGCVVAPPPGPPAPYACEEAPGAAAGQGPEISCPQPDGSVRTVAAPPAAEAVAAPPEDDSAPPPDDAPPPLPPPVYYAPPPYPDYPPPPPPGYYGD
jgi:hypothetical protein